VLPAATSEDTRYFLNAVQVQNGGALVRATATDGHVLITATTPAAAMPDADYPAVGPELAHATEALLPAAIVAQVIKATKGKHTIPILAGVKIGTDAAGRSLAVTTDLDATQTHDFTYRGDAPTFPQWDRVMSAAEKAPAGVKISLGVPVLAAILKAAAAGGGVRSITFEIPANDKTGAVIDPLRAHWTVTDRSGDVAVTAIAMPMRI
jgi:hypothetical protein